MSHPSYCCQRCGESIGWLGRLWQALRLPIHQCPIHYRFPVFIPGDGTERFIVIENARSYVQARLAAMAQVDTGKYLVGPGIPIASTGQPSDVLH